MDGCDRDAWQPNLAATETGGAKREKEAAMDGCDGDGRGQVPSMKSSGLASRVISSQWERSKREERARRRVAMWEGPNWEGVPPPK